jgi:pimeloyl-ACP methyl ester carboxylesterase
MTEPIMKKVKGDGVQINLAIWEGKAGPILCVHGITANCRCWDVLASALSPDYQVMAMDLRGRGQSDKPAAGYSLEHHLQDINCLLDDLKLERAVIMGHSLGAFIALAFAAQYPQRTDRLILVDGAGDLSAEQFDKVFVGIKPALDRLGKVFPSADAYLDRMKQAPYLHPWTPMVETYCRYEIEAVAGGVRTNIDPAHIQEEGANIRKVKSAAFYPRLQCKVLILRAPNGLLSQDDLLLPEDVVTKMTAEIPDVRRFDVADTNHYGILMKPHAARDEAIRAFLNE